MPSIDSITRWQAASGTELANAQLFAELRELLGLPRPERAGNGLGESADVFERRIRAKRDDGTEAERHVDCYRRGAFVPAARKLSRKEATRGFDEVLMKAKAQAEGYAHCRHLAAGRRCR
ncbi:MAG: hypothetical protein C0434_03090 [Xanthomonadaceae bacterium]|nr:hypothetical protein [Xanthomonadaceae bacterium]